MSLANYETSVVYRNAPRTPAGMADTLREFGVATVHEALGRAGLMKPYMRPVYHGGRACGNAVTVLLQPGDNWMMHVAAEQIREGDIVVAAVTADCPAGYFGDLLASSFKARGAKALIIDAGVRDTAQYKELGFPVWSKYICAQGTVKATPGSVNIPIICAGALVNPGDVIIADDDGVVVVPRDKLEQTAAAAKAREDAETGKRARFTEGELGLDIYSMREPLEKAGLRYID